MKCKMMNSDIRRDYVKNLLRERGVEDPDRFLNVGSDALGSYRDIDRLQYAVSILFNILKYDSKILLIVDCDCDGYTSSAIMYQYIKHINPNTEIDYLIHEGKQHGLEDHFEYLQNCNEAYDLVIIPDAGSNDAQYCEQLKDLSKNGFLILDHHILEVEPSYNMIIVNNQVSTAYKNKDLTGAGVVWQFCRSLDSAYGTTYADDLVDLAALGICGDMGSMLSEENQYIMKVGFNNIKNFMFKSLIEKQSYSMGNEVNPTSVAFYIVPLINAMIRVGSLEEKTRLFEAFIDGETLIPSKKRGANGAPEKRAIESVRECTNAKAKQTRLKDAAIDRIECKIFKEGLLDNKILFIRLEEDDDFPPELNGLVAMGLAAKFNKPTIVARLNEEGYIRGSARGLNNSELESFRDFLIESNLFEYNHGHNNAFGTSILNSNLGMFHEYANAALADMDLSTDAYKVNFERYAMEGDIEAIIADVDEHKAIFGTGNPEPLLYVKDINIKPNDVQVIGSKQDTVKILYNGIVYIKFHANDLIEDLKKYNDIKLNIVGRGNMNVWMGRATPQIIIDSYEVEDNTYGF